MPAPRVLRLRCLAVTALAASLAGCGAAHPTSPCPEGCGGDPLEAQPAVGDTTTLQDGEDAPEGDVGKGVTDIDAVETLRCKPLAAGENPSAPPVQCRVKVGPLNLGMTQGQTGGTVGVGVSTGAPADVEQPTRRQVEDEKDLEGRR